MTKKQKQMVVRIVIAFIMLAAIMVGEHTGLTDRIQPHILLAVICLVPYLIIGYDILYKAVRNIRNGQVFDENFLMMVATWGHSVWVIIRKPLPLCCFIRWASCFTDTQLESPDSRFLI